MSGYPVEGWDVPRGYWGPDQPTLEEESFWEMVEERLNMEAEAPAISVSDAAQRAYGLLWRDTSESMFSRGARRELLAVLSHEERRAGIAWAMEMFGPMTNSEMIAADIRAGVFPQKSTERRS